MSETYDRPTDEEYSAEYRYDLGEGPAVVARLWVDAHGGCWLESAGLERVVIPREARALVARRVKEAKFR